MSAAAPANRLGAVVGAFVYLQATSLYNNLRQRLLRLRQPKYLLGAVAGAAYLYAFVFRHMFKDGHARTAFTPSPDVLVDLSALAAIVLALFMLVDWLVSGDEAKLGFSETEIDFLFPAPLTRTTLIQFNLLRSQLGIFFSAFLLGFLLRRGTALNGHPLQYAIGLWLLLSMARMHMLAGSFTRNRLAGFGLHSWPRRVAVAGIALLVVFACWWPMRAQLHWPEASTWSSLDALRAWFQGIVGTAPLSWLLMPFHWALGPIFASDTAAFLRALPPALALLVLHYVWVVRAQVSFEEASIAHAGRRAKRVAAMRDGRMRQRLPTKPRSEPFKLAANGLPPLAFLWKGLIAAGSIYRLRTWLVACVVVFAGVQWLAANPQMKPALLAIGVAASMIGGWGLLMGPMLMQRSLQRTLDYLDILKATPLRGRQIAMGELLTPATIMIFGIWLLLLVGVLSFVAAGGRDEFTPGVIATAGVGAALLVPPLCGLMLCVPFAATLYFPAWVTPQKSGSRGVEVMGQRLIFMAGYMLTLVVVMIPAVLVGGLGFLLANWLAGMATGLLVAAACTCAVLALELNWAVSLLGRRIDGFDVSQELR
ncbi:putative ABC exporter domain-containing protein [Thermomonas sp.]|uniref:putative ABC exporter domain-containing protein n=1 Tax=Thermomonas sp. TaxID=1971895 RepID=UPI00248766C1|nr:putative ABC exporter domain-containing protein [Thermomonas sp.]MDI1252679.1 putative ABC exporter domain-containing protein [Thermomonas sp.]